MIDVFVERPRRGFKKKTHLPFGASAVQSNWLGPDGTFWDEVMPRLDISKSGRGRRLIMNDSSPPSMSILHLQNGKLLVGVVAGQNTHTHTHFYLPKLLLLLCEKLLFGGLLNVLFT